MSGIRQRKCRGTYGAKSLEIMAKAKNRGMLLFSDGSIRLPTGQIHRGTPQGGRDRINLSIDGERITIETARVVCFLAHGFPPNTNDVVDHIDGNTLNDKPGNLRWATYSENTRNTTFSRTKTWEQKAIDACAGMTDPAAEIEKLKGQRDRAVEALRSLRRGHHICEDNWYSCPQSGECINDAEGDECNCGAQEHNAIIADAIAEIKGGE